MFGNVEREQSQPQFSVDGQRVAGGAREVNIPCHDYGDLNEIK